MSDAPEKHARPKSSALFRTLLLIVLLLVIVGAGLWDWYGAKEPRDKAYERVLALQGNSMYADPNKPPTTQAEVHEAVGVEPSDSVTEDGLIYERFSWRRGMPWMTYDLWVLYRGEGDKAMLVAQTQERPDPIYAANAKGGTPPMPDPSTVRPPTNGPTPPPEEGSTAGSEEAPSEAAPGDDAPTTDDEPETTSPAEAPPGDDAAAEASSETPAEGADADAAGSETPAAPEGAEAEPENP